jgi:hypothetical protein
LEQQELENHQQEDKEENHKNSHHRSGSPTRYDLAVFRIEGTQKVSEAGALGHDGSLLSGRGSVWLL